MRVVHVSQPVEAGVAAVVLALVDDQRARGWQVDVVCPGRGLLAERARAAGVGVHPWEATREPGVRSLRETVRLARVLRRLSPDVIHLHSSKAGLAGRLAVRGRTATVFQPHLWSFRSADGLAGWLCRGWERVAARWTHHLVCVSEDELADGRAAGVAAPAEVVCNGVDTTAFRPGDPRAARRRLGLPTDVPLAVCVGRLAPLKGQDLLLRAWPSVLAGLPGAHLVLVGDGPMGALWREDPVAGAASVTWRGHSASTMDYYTAADVVVLPSRAEGMALVPLEAMACGRPVVAFDVGGVRQSVGDAGAVVPPGDLDALAAAITARLSDPDLAAREGLLARRRAVTLFDTRRVGEQIATLVDKLHGEGRA